MEKKFLHLSGQRVEKVDWKGKNLRKNRGNGRNCRLGLRNSPFRGKARRVRKEKRKRARRRCGEVFGKRNRRKRVFAVGGRKRCSLIIFLFNSLSICRRSFYIKLSNSFLKIWLNFAANNFSYQNLLLTKGPARDAESSSFEDSFYAQEERAPDPFDLYDAERGMDMAEDSDPLKDVYRDKKLNKMLLTNPQTFLFNGFGLIL